MTRKDYQLVADQIKEVVDELRHVDHLDAIKHTQVVQVVRAVAKAFKMDNPKFDNARFFKACGLEGDE